MNPGARFARAPGTRAPSRTSYPRKPHSVLHRRRDHHDGPDSPNRPAAHRLHTRHEPREEVTL